MIDFRPPLDGLTLAELQAARRTLEQAMVTGTLSVQFPDGTRVQYRTMDELQAALRYVNGRVAALQAPDAVDPMQRPVGAFRVRLSNGYR